MREPVTLWAPLLTWIVAAPAGLPEVGAGESAQQLKTTCEYNEIHKYLWITVMDEYVVPMLSLVT